MRLIINKLQPNKQKQNRPQTDQIYLVKKTLLVKTERNLKFQISQKQTHF